jgi:hypothetical protein
MLVWSIGIILVVLVLFAFLSAANKRTCMLAYGQGVDDAGVLPWDEIVQRYRSFLKPMRPMDAASYQRGLEYMLTTTNLDWQAMKADFVEAYKSGNIKKEGTTIIKLGAETAANNFRLRIPRDLEELILKKPHLPPLASKVEIERK